jgi:hypothetical protein
MEIKLAVEILQVAMTVDETRQNGLAFDVNHLSARGNRDCAAAADSLEPACLNNDGAIVNRRPAGAIDQSATLHDEYFLRHDFFSSFALSVEYHLLLRCFVCQPFAMNQGDALKVESTESDGETDEPF